MQFYGQWDPPVDAVLYERYFTDRHNGICIEAGAYDGVEESSCKMFEESLGWTAVNCEPVPFIFNLLCANRPDALNLNVALSDRRSTGSFTQAVHPDRGHRFGNGSLSHAASHTDLLTAQGCTFDTFEVETITYAELVAALDLRRVDLLVLDVEGHEPAAIAGMAGCPDHLLPAVMCIEYPNTGLDVLSSLVDRLGYVLDGTSFNNAFYIR